MLTSGPRSKPRKGVFLADSTAKPHFLRLLSFRMCCNSHSFGRLIFMEHSPCVSPGPGAGDSAVNKSGKTYVL